MGKKFETAKAGASLAKSLGVTPKQAMDGAKMAQKAGVKPSHLTKLAKAAK